MIDRTVTTTIDEESCIGCGECLTVCPSDTITIEDDKAVVSGEESLGCDHCASICPTDSVTVGFVSDEASSFKTFDNANYYLKPGDFDTSGLVRLMRSRRSCRNYTDQEVPLEMLEDLVKIATTAPSGTNCQMWTFTILPTRDAVLSFGERIGKFFKKLNGMAEKATMRFLSKLFMKDVLGQYYRNYYESVKEGLDDFEKGGRDRLFHGAPATIIVAVEKGSSTPAADANLATQNILLGAHSMGLGTCLIGFAVEAMGNDKKIQLGVGIPASEKVYSVITVGYPNEVYRKPCGRKMITPRISKG